MIIRNLNIDECVRLSEIDPSFETSKVYMAESENPLEPRIIAHEADPPIEVMPPIFGSVYPDAAAAYADEFDRYDLFLVAEEDGRFIGASCSLPIAADMSKVPGWAVMRGEYLLAAIAVDREHRFQGVGHALLERVKSHCREIGGSMISLWAGFDYFPSVEFYLTQGFAISGWLSPPGCKYDQCRLYLTWRA